MNNKNPETDTGVQTENQIEGKTTKSLENSYLYEIFRLKREQILVSFHLIFLSSANIKDMHHHHLASMAS